MARILLALPSMTLLNTFLTVNDIVYMFPKNKFYKKRSVAVNSCYKNSLAKQHFSTFIYVILEVHGSEKIF